MKFKFIASLLLIIVIQKANAQSCQSLFSGAENIYNSAEKSFINFRGSIAKDFVDFVIPGNSKSESALNRLIDDATNLQLKLYSGYGLIAGQGNGKIGDIDLIIPVKTFTGECFTERTFTILQSPYDKVVITVKKTDGRRGLKMKACAKYSNGSIYDEQSKDIDGGNESAGTTKTFTFSSNMYDKSISLHLVAYGGLGPTDKCAYTLSIQGYFDNDQMVALNNQNNKNNNGSSANAGNKSKTTQPVSTGDQSTNNSAIKEAQSNNSSGVKLDQNNAKVVQQKNNKQKNSGQSQALSSNEIADEVFRETDQRPKEEASMNSQVRNGGRNKNPQKALSNNEVVPENSQKTETQTINTNNRRRNQLANNENIPDSRVRNKPAQNKNNTTNSNSNSRAVSRNASTNQGNVKMKNNRNANAARDSTRAKPVNQRNKIISGQRNGN